MESNLIMQTQSIRVDVPVILNLGLCRGRFAYNEKDATDLLLAYCKTVRGVFKPHFMAEVQAAKSEDDEPTLVVSGIFNELANSTDFLANMIIKTDQDCIAIWYCDTGEGVLFGPKADEWGPFNPEFFKSPIINLEEN